MKDILKKINKKEKVIIGLTLGVLVITFVSITLKDTHAFYSDKTEISLFNAKIGNFKPIINSFYIKENNIQPKYTNQNINTVYLSWGNNNKNINEMCITEGDVDSCSWQAISNNTQYTFANDTEGEKIVKGYVRDKVGNKSIEKSDTIIYDKTVPTIESAIAEEATYNSFTINITANDNKEGVSKTSGIDKYCYGTEDSPSEEKYTCVESSKIPIKGLQELQSYTYYIYAKDKAGNSGIANRRAFTLETVSKTNQDILKEKTDSQYLKPAYEGDELVRYIGEYTDADAGRLNNYICFGTTNAETCKSNPDEFMYRIIGIQAKDNTWLGLKANQLKIIKATPIKEDGNGLRIQWAPGNGDSYCGSHTLGGNGKCNWDYAEASETEGPILQYYLNHTFLSTITGRIGEKDWQDLISNQKWWRGDLAVSTGVNFKSNKESRVASSTGFKIGLMYASDYYNSFDYTTLVNSDNGKNSWLFMQNGWSTNSTISGNAQNEWTMSRYGWARNSGWWCAWYIVTSGWLNANMLTQSFGFRPVFYVDPNITLTGEGSAENPFIIHS